MLADRQGRFCTDMKKRDREMLTNYSPVIRNALPTGKSLHTVMIGALSLIKGANLLEQADDGTLEPEPEVKAPYQALLACSSNGWTRT